MSGQQFQGHQGAYKNPISKYVHEYEYWKKKKLEKGFDNSVYEHYFTEYFELGRKFYEGKRIADLDPLAEAYQYLGAHEHEMSYSPDYIEDTSFPDDYFDVVSSFNSLDHVDDLDRAVREIKRIVKPGGLFLLMTDISSFARPTEPRPLDWNICRRFEPEFEVADERHLENGAVGGCYEAASKRVSFDHTNPEDRVGALTARMVRKA